MYCVADFTQWYGIIACNTHSHCGEHIDCGCTNGNVTVTSAWNFKGEEHVYLLQTVRELVDHSTVKFPEGRTDDTFKAGESLCAVKMHSVMQTNDQKAVQSVGSQRTVWSFKAAEGAGRQGQDLNCRCFPAEGRAGCGVGGNEGAEPGRRQAYASGGTRLCILCAYECVCVHKGKSGHQSTHSTSLEATR